MSCQLHASEADYLRGYVAILEGMFKSDDKGKYTKHEIAQTALTSLNEQYASLVRPEILRTDLIGHDALVQEGAWYSSSSDC